MKNWFTLNEPWSYANLGYATGNLAPGRCSRWQRLGCIDGDSGTEPYWVAHNLLLSHAAAVNIYRNKYQVRFEYPKIVLLRNLSFIYNIYIYIYIYSLE